MKNVILPNYLILKQVLNTLTCQNAFFCNLINWVSDTPGLNAFPLAAMSKQFPAALACFGLSWHRNQHTSSFLVLMFWCSESYIKWSWWKKFKINKNERSRASTEKGWSGQGLSEQLLWDTACFQVVQFSECLNVTEQGHKYRFLIQEK